MNTFIVGNWKMNFTVGEASIYLQKLSRHLQSHRGVTVVVAPTFLALQPLALQLSRQKKQHKIQLAAQDCYYRDSGAFTGEVSATQLRGLVKYAIIGHSERRHILGETNKDICAKVAACLRNKITPLLCVGETADQRTFGETADVIRDQLLSGLADVSTDELNKVIIAYEPVWAISSTGGAKVAIPDEVANVIQLIHSTLIATYGKAAAADTPVLYGGSVNPANAGAYLTIPGVNGLLVGGASLIANQFVDIINVAKRVQL